MKEDLLAYGARQANRVAYLVAGYTRKTLTEAEHDELDRWVEASDANMLLFEELTEERDLQANLAWMDALSAEKSLPRTQSLPRISRPFYHKKRLLWPLLAAACLLLVAWGIYLLTYTGKKAHLAVVHPPVVLPDNNKTTLTLGNGQVIDLEAAGIGPIQKGGTKMEKTGEGLLTYQKTGSAPSSGVDTLAVARGGRYSITLSDGTRVWLNALSTLSFPEQFSPNNREVWLSGEAFFQVFKDVEHPFIVRLSDSTMVRVLGTRFNVFAYRDEAVKRVSLVEGRVEVSTQKVALQLAPGDQFLIYNGRLRLEKGVDTTAATAWKSGRFVFRDADLYQVMREAQRWYGVQVVYRAQCSEHFNFSLSRAEPLSKLLHLMELTGKIHFTTGDKTVYVVP